MSLDAHPEPERLLEAARDAPPMTPAQRREQGISWAYGNCALANPNITREMVEKAYDEMHGKSDRVAE